MISSFINACAQKEPFQVNTGLERGFVDPGEAPVDAARRELKEETGLELPLSYAFTIEFDDSDFKQISHLFVAQAKGFIPNDHSEWQWSGWLPKAKVDELLAQGHLCTDTAELYKRYVQRSTGNAGGPPPQCK